MGDEAVTVASSSHSPQVVSTPSPLFVNTTAGNVSDLLQPTISAESFANNASTEFYNSTFSPVTSDQEGDDGLLLSLPIIIGIAVGSVTLLIIIIVVVIGVYHRKRRKKLPTGKLKMGPRHAVQPEQYPGLFDDRDDIVSLSYINVHMAQPKRTREEDIISLDSDGYLNSLENPMYECHQPKSNSRPFSACSEM
ncbi:hypothetical protein CAPTEDRAFT_225309 [Capitella teleta]|uniref:Uncharacterized protein n=1 Tax=Capitella teleta TaxID=283909 RepID=R7T9J0_CAPTE|nr:hypothetical protein CAPTEDRAFT_225309 [Capitella teleta]|eukprot:ELT90359.1 hypothetical protein CAPTEDRAFT_225309 [Capitella teleta]